MEMFRGAEGSKEKHVTGRITVILGKVTRFVWYTAART